MHLAADEVQRLIAGGADANARDDKGWSPLHFAAQANSADIAKTLLVSGVQIGAADSNGNMPLKSVVLRSCIFIGMQHAND